MCSWPRCLNSAIWVSAEALYLSDPSSHCFKASFSASRAISWTGSDLFWACLIFCSRKEWSLCSSAGGASSYRFLSDYLKRLLGLKSSRWLWEAWSCFSHCSWILRTYSFSSSSSKSLLRFSKRCLTFRSLRTLGSDPYAVSAEVKRFYSF